MNKIAVGIVAAVIILAGIIFWAFKKGSYLSFDNSAKTYQVLKKWELPEILEEVSGLSYLGNHEFAGIQDEDGILFIYDVNQSAISSRIPFGEKGDYEGLTFIDNTAYVVRSDGKLFEISHFRNKNPKVDHYQISGLDINEMESLEADKKNNRLLFAVKEYNNRQKRKGIYEFDLTRKKLNREPVMELDGAQEIYRNLKGGASSQIIRASAIRFHPQTKELYILDGHQPKLIILDKKGIAYKIHLLDPEIFPQPEGLSFDDENNLYISNESRRQPANILKVKLDD